MATSQADMNPDRSKPAGVNGPQGTTLKGPVEYFTGDVKIESPF